MSKSDVPVAVSEQDKPFILALTGVGVLVGEVSLAAYMTIIKADTTIVKDAITATLTLVSTAFGYYFAKKS